MKFRNPKELVLMHGPALDGSGAVVERKVVAGDVAAYRNVGYNNGPIPVEVNLRARVAELEAQLERQSDTAKEAPKKGKKKDAVE
jgi:hypothetical protein